jgi:hypothetical protein
MKNAAIILAIKIILAGTFVSALIIKDPLLITSVICIGYLVKTQEKNIVH